jgi:hypothetical protein
LHRRLERPGTGSGSFRDEVSDGQCKAKAGMTLSTADD